jgi:hypothetical protein
LPDKNICGTLTQKMRSSSVRVLFSAITEKARIKKVKPGIGLLELSGGMHATFDKLNIGGRPYGGQLPHEIQLKPGMTVPVEIADGKICRINLPEPKFSWLGGLFRDIRTWLLDR